MPTKSKAKGHKRTSRTPDSAPVKIAILGFGTVGSSVARLLAELNLPGIELTHIFNRDVARKRISDRVYLKGNEPLW